MLKLKKKMRSNELSKKIIKVIFIIFAIFKIDSFLFNFKIVSFYLY